MSFVDGDQKNIRLTQSSLSAKEINKQIELQYAAYADLLQKRSALQEEIKKSLIPKSESLTLNSWWRLTTYKYAQDPLNASGSCKSPTGGRFNIGQIDATKSGKFAMFPALYVAETKETALSEVYPRDGASKLSSTELMLSSESADIFVKIRGSVSIFDIDKPRNLTSFIKLIKDIKFSPAIKKMMKNHKTVQTVKELKRILYFKNWRDNPNLLDNPAPSQIFGQIIKSCGIEGIKYSSIQSNKKNNFKCLALFLENFEDSGSFIEIIDSDIEKNRIDKYSFKGFFVSWASAPSVWPALKKITILSHDF